MLVLLIVVVLLTVATAYMFMHEERPVLFPPPKQPTFLEIMVRMQRAYADAAITIGEAVLPAFRQAAEALNKFAEAFAEKR